MISFSALFSLFLFLTYPGNPAPPPDAADFHDLFTEIEFETLHLYSFAHRAGEFRETQLYPFKGRRIDPAFLPVFRNHITSIDLNPADSHYYACQRFYLTDTLEILLMREFHEGGMEHHIHYIVYDNRRQQLTQVLKATFAYGYEGSTGSRDSYITDLNGDGLKDLLVRTVSQSYIGSDAEEHSTDSTVMYVWSKEGLISIPVKDAKVEEVLHTHYPMYEPIWLTSPESDVLKEYMGRQANIPEPDPYDRYFVVTERYLSLDSAQTRIEALRDIIGMNGPYGVDVNLISIRKKGHYFYLLMSDHYNETEARIIKEKLREIYCPEAHIVHEEVWCGHPEYHGGYYECAD